MGDMLKDLPFTQNRVGLADKIPARPKPSSSSSAKAAAGKAIANIAATHTSRFIS